MASMDVGHVLYNKFTGNGPETRVYQLFQANAFTQDCGDHSGCTLLGKREVHGEFLHSIKCIIDAVQQDRKHCTPCEYTLEDLLQAENAVPQWFHWDIIRKQEKDD